MSDDAKPPKRDTLPVTYNIADANNDAHPVHYVPTQQEAQDMEEFGRTVRRRAEQGGVTVTSVGLCLSDHDRGFHAEQGPLEQGPYATVSATRAALRAGDHRGTAGEMVVEHELGHLGDRDNETHTILEFINESVWHLSAVSRAIRTTPGLLLRELAATAKEGEKPEERIERFAQSVRAVDAYTADAVARLQKTDAWAMRKDDPLAIKEHWKQNPQAREALVETILPMQAGMDELKKTAYPELQNADLHHASLTGNLASRARQRVANADQEFDVLVHGGKRKSEALKSLGSGLRHYETDARDVADFYERVLKAREYRQDERMLRRTDGDPHANMSAYELQRQKKESPQDEALIRSSLEAQDAIIKGQSKPYTRKISTHPKHSDRVTHMRGVADDMVKKT